MAYVTELSGLERKINYFSLQSVQSVSYWGSLRYSNEITNDICDDIVVQSQCNVCVGSGMLYDVYNEKRYRAMQGTTTTTMSKAVAIG